MVWAPRRRTRAINAAAAAAATLNQTIDLGMTRTTRTMSSSMRSSTMKMKVFRRSPLFAHPREPGVVRAKLDPLRSARRAYEYIHGVGWVLEMYYGRRVPRCGPFSVLTKGA